MRKDRHLLPPDCWDDRDRREDLASKAYEPLGRDLPAAPIGPRLSDNFGGLWDKPRKRDRGAQVDRLLVDLGIKPGR